MNKECDLENIPVNDRYAEGTHTVPPPVTGNYMPSGPDVEIDYSKVTYVVNESKVVSEPKVVCKPKVWTDAPIIEKEYVKETGTPNHCPKIKKQDRHSHTRKGFGYARKSCFVCGSFSHLIRDYDFHEKRMAKQAALTKNKEKGTGQQANRPVWNIVQIINHQNKFVPSAVLTKTGKIPVNVARQNFSRQAASTSTASKVNTARPFVNETRPKRYFYKSHSPNKRPFHNKTTQTTTFSYNKVNTVNTSLSAVKGHWDTDVKALAVKSWLVQSKQLLGSCLRTIKDCSRLGDQKAAKKVKKIERKIKARTPGMTLFKIGKVDTAAEVTEEITLSS
nr:hypothetical protein [Tanacetum cinerariifolium]